MTAALAAMVMCAGVGCGAAADGSASLGDPGMSTTPVTAPDAGDAGPSPDPTPMSPTDAPDAGASPAPDAVAPSAAPDAGPDAVTTTADAGQASCLFAGCAIGLVCRTEPDGDLGCLPPSTPADAGLAVDAGPSAPDAGDPVATPDAGSADADVTPASDAAPAWVNCTATSCPMYYACVIVVDNGPGMTYTACSTGNGDRLCTTNADCGSPAVCRHADGFATGPLTCAQPVP